MEFLEILESLNRKLDVFFEKVIAKEERDIFVEQRINRLEDIILGNNKDYWFIEDRFRGLESWLKNEGLELNSKPLGKKYIQRLIECVVKIKASREISDVKKDSNQYVKKVLLQANSFLRDNLRRGGWEYTPLGLMESVQLDESLLKLKEDIRTTEGEDADLKSGYHRILTYQLDLLASFYKPKDHLLTILDYQLKSLEINPTKEDEIFTASLIYYLKQK
ncbi:MAG: hypothetical protein OEV55_07815, partial [candidate division Zixibacteria bacterium]|nr:hypothetical protein [candidate division Zixibacteria bacterium]